MAGELIELVVGNDPNLRFRVTSRIQQIIARSFSDGARQTRSEVTRRFRIVELLLREMRAGFGWPFERILDEMPAALRHKLDGTPWDPHLNRNTWSGSGVVS